jgi:hypothetical protein
MLAQSGPLRRLPNVWSWHNGFLEYLYFVYNIKMKITYYIVYFKRFKWNQIVHWKIYHPLGEPIMKQNYRTKLGLGYEDAKFNYL